MPKVLIGRLNVLVTTIFCLLSAVTWCTWKFHLENKLPSVNVVQTQPQTKPLDSSTHSPYGSVDPRLEVPELKLTGADGKTKSLSQLLSGHTTAVQLVFTQCTSICPTQGALFAATAKIIPIDARLLSISIDPDADNPSALRSWMSRFGSSRLWQAATPMSKMDVETLLDFLDGRTNRVDRHSEQVYIFDIQGRLAYRTQELPSRTEIVNLLMKINGQ